TLDVLRVAMTAALGMPLRRCSRIASLAALLALLAACGTQARAALGRHASPPSSRTASARSPTATGHFEYVFVDGALDIYAMAHGSTCRMEDSRPTGPGWCSTPAQARSSAASEEAMVHTTRSSDSAVGGYTWGRATLPTSRSPAPPATASSDASARCSLECDH